MGDIFFLVSCYWSSSFQLVWDLGVVALNWFGTNIVLWISLAAVTNIVPTHTGSQSASVVHCTSPKRVHEQGSKDILYDYITFHQQQVAPAFTPVFAPDGAPVHQILKTWCHTSGTSVPDQMSIYKPVFAPDGTET